MNTKLTIKNFRVFDENGVTVDLKPITVLTGCNSSGKSSVVKAALMLNDVLRQLKNFNLDTNLNKIKIDFTKYPNNLLGRFDKVLNNSKSGKITIEYTIYSYMISKDVTVSLEFVADMEGKLNNARLDNFKVSIDEGVIFWSEKDEEADNSRRQTKKERLDREKNEDTRGIATDWDSLMNVYSYKVNANLVKKEFLDYAVFRCLIIVAYNNFMDWGDYQLSDERFKNINAFIDEAFPELSQEHQISDNRLQDIAHSRKNNICLNTQDINVVESVIENNSLFFIPILEDLDKINKDDFEKYVSDNDFIGSMSSLITSDGYSSYTDKYIELISETCSLHTKEVVDSFIASDSSKFSEFFAKLEKNNFENAYFLNFTDFSIVDNPNCGIKDLWEEKSLFSKTYIILMFWNLKIHPEKTPVNELKTSEMPPIGTKKWFSQKSVEIFDKFLDEFYDECISPSFYGPMTYISSSRATIKRLYQLDQKDDFTLLLKKYMESEKQGFFINKWIKKFGIGDSISFDIDDDGVGVKIHIHKTPDDKKGRLLADEGYGITQLLSIMLQIEMSSISDKLTLAVEEPEIHLHPKYQSLLADMFVDAFDPNKDRNKEKQHTTKKHSIYADKLVELYRSGFVKKRGIHFIIETHSEYLIRRLQLLVAGIETEQKLDKNDVSISYIYTKDEAEKENQPIVKNIAICEDGYLDDTFGSGFFDEATNLSRKLM